MRTGSFIRTSLLGTTILAAAAMGLAAAPAGAATDTSPPTWTKLPAASIPLGAVLSGIGCEDGSGSPADGSQLRPINIDYQGADAQSGIDHYEVAPDFGNGPEDVGLLTRIAMSGWTEDPADCVGGPRPGFTGYAVNGSGLESTVRYYDPRKMRVVQDTPSSSVVYSGSWAASNSTSFAGGTTRKTTQKKAAARFTVTVPSTTASLNTSALALVMAKGPDRGKAQVWLDGVKVATINTNSATKINRTVVWRVDVAPGAHTLRVVNLATAGHARIDIDAFILLPKGSVPF